MTKTHISLCVSLSLITDTITMIEEHAEIKKHCLVIDAAHF